jgi:hypothetical protein
MTEHILSLIVAAPFVAALILLFLPPKQLGLIRFTAALGAFVSLVLSLYVAFLYNSQAGGLQLSEVYPLVPSLGIELRLAVDGWGVSLLILTGVIIFAGVLASTSLADRAKEFFVLLLVLVAGVFGVFVSQDLFVFFLFYEIAVLPMYLLIGIWGSSHKVTEAGPLRFVWKWFDIGGREYAAMKLTLMLLVGSAFILVGLLALYFSAGAGTFDMAVLAKAHYPRSLQLWAFVLFWLGFGSLAGVFPFHTWSPDGHASAPTAVSMLHAGVLMKLGAFGVMRIGMMMLPDGARFWAPVVGAVAVVNVVYGALSRSVAKRPQVHHRLLVGQPHGRGHAWGGDADPERLERRHLPDVCARHHDRPVLRPRRSHLRAGPQSRGRQDGRLCHRHARRRCILHPRGFIVAGTAWYRWLRRRVPGLRRRLAEPARLVVAAGCPRRVCDGGLRAAGVASGLLRRGPEPTLSRSARCPPRRVGAAVDLGRHALALWHLAAPAPRFYRSRDE